MPYYKDTLLSAWPSTLISEVGAPPVKFDPQFVASHVPIKDTGIVYGPNTRGLLRNQVVDTRAPEKGKSALKQPKFLSEKARETASSTPEPSARTADAGELTEGQDSGVPSKYHQLEIKYSKFGIDDFDFGCVPLLILPNTHIIHVIHVMILISRGKL